MNASDVVSKTRFYSQARENIKHDRNLSPAGIERALKNLEESISLFRNTAYGVLFLDWRDARRMSKEVDEMRAQAERAEGERWNHSKLLAEQNGVERRLQGFRELKDVASFTEQALNSGNLEHARAVAEAVPGVVRSRFPGLEGEHVARAAERRLAVMLNTPELERVKQRESEGGKAVLQLMKDTEEVSSFYSPGVMWGGNEFSKLLENVKVSTVRKVNPDDPWGAFERTTIEFVPEPVEA